MEKAGDPGRAYARELLWAALMVNVVMGLVGLLVGSHLGSPWLGLVAFLGGGVVITAGLGLLVLINAAVVRLRERRGGRGAP